MKSHLLIGVSIMLCLVFVFFPNEPYQTPIRKMTEPVTIIKEENTLTEWTKMIEKYLTFPLNDNNYGSHAIVLLAAVYVSKSGPIVELGMGSTSSPLLHRLSLDQNRQLLSADSDIRWINYFSSFSSNNTLHRLKYIEIKSQMGVEWAKMNLENYTGWSVVFIDHRPGSRRQFDLIFYSQNNDLVVLHDTEKSSLYNYDKGLALYRYRYRFTRLEPYTDILSSTKESLIRRIRYLLESTPAHYFFSNTTLKEKI